MSARNVKLNVLLAVAMVLGLLFAAAPGKVMAAVGTPVSTEAELRTALEDVGVTEISITANIGGISAPIVVNRAVTLNGNGFSLSFNGLEAMPTTVDDGLIIQAPTTVNNLVVNAGLSVPTAWVGTYAIHVYKTSATLNNVTATGANGGILVNGSTVTLTGAIDVSGNGFGGIESSKGSGVTEIPALNVTGATITNSTEAYTRPTMWEDIVTGTVTANANQFTTNTTINTTQVQYYLEPAHAILSVIYVNNAWSAVTVGADPDGAGPAHIFGLDSFATIQAAIDAATGGNTINVAAGTYPERINITKPLLLIGAGIGQSSIDATGFDTSGNVIDITTKIGNTLIQGFDINTGDHSNGIHFSGGTDAGGKIEIFANHIIGTNSGSDQFGIIGGYHDLRALYIDGNEISNTYDNSILLELQQGLSEITDNTFNGAFPSIFFMTYDGLNVTATQKISRNTFDMSSADASSGVAAIGVNPATYYVAADRRIGVYSNFEISGNTITGLDDLSFKGISIGENSVDGTSGGFTNLDIFGNTITGTDGKGIQFYGHITGAEVYENSITGLAQGIKGFTYESTFYPENNNIYHNAVSGATNLLVYWTGTTVFDVEENWWGSIYGPSSVATNVDADPWCGDAACSFLVSGTPVTDGVYFENGKLTLAGDVNIAEGIEINEPGLTVLLKNGTVVKNSSPCFVVHAAPVTITAETIGGAVCVPTDGSNGIDVDAGLTNVIISGIEFSGIDSLDVNQSTGAGIYFHGAVTDVQIVDNYFHDLDGAGVVFGTVTNNQGIQGNLFQRLGAAPIVYSGPTLNAEYNSWNQYAIPTVTAVDTDPATHVDLYLVSSGTPTANVVVNGQQITYTVRGDLRNIAGASFILNYDTTKLDLVSAASSGLFNPVPDKLSVLDTTTDGVIKFDGVSTPAITGTAQDLFTVVFTATASGDAPLTFDTATDLFSMAPGYGPSSNVYAALLDNKTVTVVDPLALTGLDLYESVNESNWAKVFGTLAGGYTMGIDPANQFEFLDAQAPTVNRKLADGLYPFFLSQTGLPGTFWTYWAGNGVTETATGWQETMWRIINSELPMFYLKVSNTGTAFDLIDGLQHELGNDVALRVSGDYPLGAYTFNGSVADGYGFTDALSVQINFIEPLALTALDLSESVNTTDWTKVFGTLAGGYTMGIDPVNQYEFLDALAPTVNRTLADGLYPFFLSQTGLPANFWTYWAGNGVVSGADLVWEQKMWQIINGELPMFYLKVSSAGTVFDLIDGLQHELGSDVALRVSGDYPLGTYAFTGYVADNFFVVDPITVQITFVGFYDVTGTFSMQGRLIRTGVPVTLTGIMNPVPFSGTTINQISSNLSLLDLIADTYIITTDQERYLDVVLTNDKTITVSAAKTAMSPLELKGGDANDDNKVEVGDAAIVGASYGIGTILSAGDVNFDDKVNIFDLALVGGNYNLTSTVYNSWLP